MYDCAIDQQDARWAYQYFSAIKNKNVEVQHVGHINSNTYEFLVANNCLTFIAKIDVKSNIFNNQYLLISNQ